MQRVSAWRNLVLVPLFYGLTSLAEPTVAHGPDLDSDLSDWCFASAPRVENSAERIACPIGTEDVWWDAPADAAVNDLGTLATTQDASGLYWAAELHVDPDPVSLLFLEIAIDVEPGGNGLWWDPRAALRAPGQCSADTSRLCTTDEDCHFCTLSTVYTGTPDERPRPCGSTLANDTCSEDPADACDRSQVCEDPASAPAVPSVGSFSDPASAPDYLLVIDFGRYLIAACDSIRLLRADGDGWVEIPRPVPDPGCPLPTWHFSLSFPGPGIPGQGPAGVVEWGLPWEAFDCPGCAPFEHGDDFRWTFLVSRGSFTLDYSPSGAIEDVASEAVAGTSTTTTNDCAGPGTTTTLCEIADGSTDAFLPLISAAPGGSVDGLTLRRGDGTPTPSITLTWNPSCSEADTDYEVYEGQIGSWYSHAGPASEAICSTGGATSATFDSGAGDHYYLVVPRNESDEGSYGRAGDGQERPVALPPCTGQSLGGCGG